MVSSVLPSELEQAFGRARRPTYDKTISAEYRTQIIQLNMHGRVEQGRRGRSQQQRFVIYTRGFSHSCRNRRSRTTPWIHPWRVAGAVVQQEHHPFIGESCCQMLQRVAANHNKHYSPHFATLSTSVVNNNPGASVQLLAYRKLMISQVALSTPSARKSPPVSLISLTTLGASSRSSRAKCPLRTVQRHVLI